jgi:hypothetical protein
MRTAEKWMAEKWGIAFVSRRHLFAIHFSANLPW